MISLLIYAVNVHKLINQYTVSMYPPVAGGLSVKSSTKTESILQEETVGIASAYADGPLPVAYSPIQYDNMVGKDGRGKEYADLIVAV